MSSTFQRPLQLNPRFSERPWGGNRLRGFLGKDAPTNGPAIGESWELSDHADGKSIVTCIDSTINGLAFGEVVRRHPLEMIGREQAPATYPLLVKYLDAADNLSVQVHPDDEWCRETGHPDRGKSECWYVIDCAPGASIVYGYKEGVTEEDARQAVRTGKLRDLLVLRPIAPGDFIPVPPRTVHALMAGTLICEVQQSSNTTFRLYDWDRLPARALHIEESMAVTNWDTASLPAITSLGPIGSGLVKAPRQQLVRNAFFDVAIHELPANGSRGSADVLSPTGAILNVVGGSGRMMGEGWTVELRLGATWYLPAAMKVRPSIHAGETGLRLLVSESLEL